MNYRSEAYKPEEFSKKTTQNVLHDSKTVEPKDGRSISETSKEVTTSMSKVYRK